MLMITSAPPRITCSSTGPPGDQLSSQLLKPTAERPRADTGLPGALDRSGDSLEVAIEIAHRRIDLGERDPKRTHGQWILTQTKTPDHWPGDPVCRDGKPPAAREGRRCRRLVPIEPSVPAGTGASLGPALLLASRLSMRFRSRLSRRHLSPGFASSGPRGLQPPTRMEVIVSLTGRVCNPFFRPPPRPGGGANVGEMPQTGRAKCDGQLCRAQRRISGSVGVLP